MSTVIPHVKDVIARRDAISPSSEMVLKVIKNLLIDSEYVRKCSPNFAFQFDYPLTVGDISNIRNNLQEAGYVSIYFQEPDIDGSYLIKFSIPDIWKGLS